MARVLEEGVVRMSSDSSGAGVSPTSKWQHPPSFYCPISRQFMHDPVVVSDGHSYERQYIERWLHDHSTSPVSGLPLEHKAVFPNHSLRNAIAEYFTQVFSAHRMAIRKTMRQPPAGAGGDALLPSVPLVHAIDALMQCSLLVNADMNIECVLKKIMDEARTLLGAEAASVFLFDAERQELYSTVNSTGLELRIPVTVGIAGCVARSGEPLIIHNAYSDSRFHRTVDAKTGFRTRSILCVPLQHRKGGIIGVAELINKTTSRTIAAEQTQGQEEPGAADAFTDHDLHFATVFASQAATAIMNNAFFANQPVQTADQVASFSTESSDSTQGAKEERRPFVPQGDDVIADRILGKAFDSWEFDALALAEVTANRPLSTLCAYLFGRLGLVSKLGLDPEKLCTFLEKVERGYDDANPYHNRSHAASVVHSMHAFLEHGGVLKTVAPAFAGEGSCGSERGDRARRCDLERLACLLAAAVHDYDHKGLNNDFLVKTSHERAIRYNDQHVNEHHHVAAAFELLLRPENNFLASLPAGDFQRLKRLVVDLVLGTDMAQHGKLLQAADEAFGPRSGAEATPAPASHAQGVLLLQLTMKCADLGHLALGWGLHLKWVDLLEEEFFLQGDKEKDAGLKVSFNMDRCKPGASATQVGFFDFVVLPLFRALTQAAPGASPALAAVEANYVQWKNREEEAAPKEGALPKAEVAPKEGAAPKVEAAPEEEEAAPRKEASSCSRSRRGARASTWCLAMPEAEEAWVSPTRSLSGAGEARRRATRLWSAICRSTSSRSPVGTCAV